MTEEMPATYTASELKLRELNSTLYKECKTYSWILNQWGIKKKPPKKELSALKPKYCNIQMQRASDVTVQQGAESLPSTVALQAENSPK